MTKAQKRLIAEIEAGQTLVRLRLDLVQNDIQSVIVFPDVVPCARQIGLRHA